MASPPCTYLYKTNVFCKTCSIPTVGLLSSLRLREPKSRPAQSFSNEMVSSKKDHMSRVSTFVSSKYITTTSKKLPSTVPRCSESSNLSGGNDEPSKPEKTPFGYSRKDVLLIGLGVTVGGIGMESGLEYLGVDPLQAGNVVQLVLVLGLTIGWISTYIFRVSNKEMTYAQQLRDYEVKVMEKRLESLTEAEIVALLEQVEEEKRQLAGGEQAK